MDGGIPHALVIGGGRIGTALVQQSQLRGLHVPLLTRLDGWQALKAPAGPPIAVCVRNDDLDAVVQRVPAHRRADLVFLQNGMLRPWLGRQGLDNATRGLLFFAVGQRGDAPLPGGTSPLTGPQAQAMAQWLAQLGLPAMAVAPGEFADVEVEKLLWNCAFGLMCQVYGCSVGQVVLLHRGQLSDLCAELLALAGPACGAELELQPLVERLCQYSLAIGDYRGAVKEWPWRNGWFVQQALAKGADCPVHTGLLQRIGR
jgi:ketopantoate reductase